MKIHIWGFAKNCDNTPRPNSLADPPNQFNEFINKIKPEAGTSESGFLKFEKWKVKTKSFHSFSRSAKWKKMLSLFFEKCKVKSKCFHSFSRSEKWNQNASRSRSRSENSREFWTILEKRDFWTGWNQLVRKPGAEQGGGAHNCQWKRGEGDLFQAACTNNEQHLRTTINITNND